MILEKNKPKVLIFSHICCPSYMTGAEKLLLLFLREMANLWTCVLVVPQEGDLSRKARIIGVPAMCLPIPICNALYKSSPTAEQQIRRLQRNKIYQHLDQLLKQESPVAVFVNTAVNPLPAVAAKKRGIYTIWCLMEVLESRLGIRKAASFICQNSDIVLGISESTLHSVKTFCPYCQTFLLFPYVPEESHIVHKYLLTRDKIRASLKWQDGILIGFLAAAIYSKKGLHFFLQAMIPIAASYPSTRFVIAGSFINRLHENHCRKIVAKSGFCQQFIFLPFIAQNELIPGLDLVVVPSIGAEGFGMVALESMMFSKPVVAFASGGVQEFMSKTENQQYLLSPGDTLGLTREVANFVTDDQLRRTVGVKNQQKVLDCFSIFPFRQKLNDLQKIIQSAKQTPRAVQVLRRARIKRKKKYLRPKRGSFLKKKKIGGKKYVSKLRFRTIALSSHLQRNWKKKR